MSDDNRVDVLRSGAIDTAVVDAIRDAKHRLSNRVYAPNDRVRVYVGDDAWLDLNGDYYDIQDKAMAIGGMPVVRNGDLPESRVMLVAESALTDIEYEAVPKERMGEFINEPFSDQSTEATVKVTGQILDRVEAIEFVPGMEVDDV